MIRPRTTSQPLFADGSGDRRYDPDARALTRWHPWQVPGVALRRAGAHARRERNAYQ